MAVVTDQNIPAELKTLYEGALGTSEWVPDTYRVHKRIPFRLPRLQGCRTIRPWIFRGDQVSNAMCWWRHIFGDACRCYGKQPATGGAEPDGYGPYGRDWWFNEAIGKLPWYFNYFMMKTLDLLSSEELPKWCTVFGTCDATVRSDQPDTNFGSTGELYTAIGNHTFRSYIKTPNPDIKVVYLQYAIPSAWNGGPIPPIFYAWETSDDWQENIITWNNKPALGKLIGIRIIAPWDTYRWVRFPMGNTGSIALTVRTGNGWRYFLSRDYGTVALRPRFGY